MLLLAATSASLGIDGSLSGHHLRITSVAEAKFADIIDPISDSLLPESEWGGLIPRMIEWIAAQAGFTYTLVTTSGNGSSCSPHGGAAADSVYAVQYGCAQQDVTELGISDVYAGSFYVTEPRMRAGLMTTPYDCNSGLAVFSKGAPSSIPEYIELQKNGFKGAACTALGAAYPEWLALNLPALQQKQMPKKDWIASIRAGECDGFILPKPIGDILANSVCDLELSSGEVSCFLNPSGIFHADTRAVRTSRPRVKRAMTG